MKCVATIQIKMLSNFMKIETPNRRHHQEFSALSQPCDCGVRKFPLHNSSFRVQNLFRQKLSFVY